MGDGYMIALPWGIQATLGDVLTVIGLLGGLVGLVFVAIQVSAGARQLGIAAVQAKVTTEQAVISAKQTELAATAQRGRFLLDVINRYFDDPEMLKLYYLIDSDSFVYSPDTAPAVSRTLYYFDSVMFLVSKGLITLEDVAILMNRIDAFFRNEEIQRVLKDIYVRDRIRKQTPDHVLAQALHSELQGIG